MSAMVAPSLILLALINFYPIVIAVSQSLHDGSLLNSGDFVGFANYAEVLSDANFWSALRFTVVFTVVGAFGSWAVGMALAMALRSGVPGRSVFRVLLVLPWVIPIVCSAASWQWLTSTQSSPVPQLTSALGLGEQLFLADPTLAQITVCVYKVWVSFPFLMIMMGAALESVDHSMYEAASLDGANHVKRFRYVTLPMTARSSYIGLILMMIFCVNDFPTIYLLTGGGPVGATQSLVVLAYQEVFQTFRVGYGVSISILMTLVLITISIVLFRKLTQAVKA